MQSNCLHVDTIALFANSSNMKAILFCPKGLLSLLQITQVGVRKLVSCNHITQLFTCKGTGAEIIFHDGDLNSCNERAKQFANDHNYIFIDHEFSTQVISEQNVVAYFAIEKFSLIGYSTIAGTKVLSCMKTHVLS